jgi:hypothetical protein
MCSFELHVLGSIESGGGVYTGMGAIDEGLPFRDYIA